MKFFRKKASSKRKNPIICTCKALTDDFNFKCVLQFLSTHAKFDDSQAIPGRRFKHGYF
jgi:hypothetical protein